MAESDKFYESLQFSKEKFDLIRDIETLKELSRQSQVMQNMFTVMDYQKEAESVDDPMITDVFEHSDPKITKL